MTKQIVFTSSRSKQNRDLCLAYETITFFSPKFHVDFTTMWQFNVTVQNSVRSDPNVSTFCTSIQLKQRSLNGSYT